jgi:uncharacterized protein YndB with AHSA1/START domain
MNPPDIRVATLVRAQRERVYDALTRAEELDAWFTTGAEIDARAGGEMVWRWVDWGPDRVTAEDRGPVLEATRPERFVFRWQAGLGGTTVEVDFDEAAEGAEGTVVRLREHGYPDTQEGWAAFSECSVGWGEALTLLKFHVEHGAHY